MKEGQISNTSIQLMIKKEFIQNRWQGLITFLLLTDDVFLFFYFGCEKEKKIRIKDKR